MKSHRPTPPPSAYQILMVTASLVTLGLTGLITFTFLALVAQ